MASDYSDDWAAYEEEAAQKSDLFARCCENLKKLSDSSWGLYKEYKRAGQRFKPVANEVKALSLILRELGDESDDNYQRVAPHTYELALLIDDCMETIDEQSKALKNHLKVIDRKSQRRDRLLPLDLLRKEFEKDISAAESFLNAHCNNKPYGQQRLEQSHESSNETENSIKSTREGRVNAEDKVARAEPTDGIRAKLEAIHGEIIRGERDPTFLDILDRATLKQELVDDGVTEVDFEQNKDTIYSWLRQVQQKREAANESSLLVPLPNQSHSIRSSEATKSNENPTVYSEGSGARSSKYSEGDTGGECESVFSPAFESGTAFTIYSSYEQDRLERSVLGSVDGDSEELTDGVSNLNQMRPFATSLNAIPEGPGRSLPAPAPLRSSSMPQKQEGTWLGKSLQNSPLPSRQNTFSSNASRDSRVRAPNPGPPRLTSELPPGQPEYLEPGDPRCEPSPYVQEKLLTVRMYDLFHGMKARITCRTRSATGSDTSGGVTKTQWLAVPIKKGTRPGMRVVLEGQGDEIDGGFMDVHVTICEARDDPFKRDGDDLFLWLDISLSDALCGWKTTCPVQALDGKIFVTSNSPTDPNWRKKYVGRGMPNFYNPKKRGNLYIGINIVNWTADRLTTEWDDVLKKALEEANSHYAPPRVSDANNPGNKVYKLKAEASETP